MPQRPGHERGRAAVDQTERIVEGVAPGPSLAVVVVLPLVATHVPEERSDGSMPLSGVVLTLARPVPRDRPWGDRKDVLHEIPAHANGLCVQRVLQRERPTQTVAGD